jgi:hypothetical protein
VIDAADEEELVDIDATPIEPIEIEPDIAGDVDGVDQAPTGQARDDDSRGPELAEEAPPTPAHARLGSEGVLRMRARYAEVLARISERIPDPARQDELKTQAERLNPDTWVTDAEVSAGLEEYEMVFEALRTAVGGQGRGRRHKRRRSGGQPEQAGRQPEDRKTEDS